MNQPIPPQQRYFLGPWAVEPTATPMAMRPLPQPDGRVVLEVFTVIGPLCFQIDSPDAAEKLAEALKDAATEARSGLTTMRSPLFGPNGNHLPRS